MELIAPILLILGGILAISNLIVAKRPDAQEMINKLVPFQGAIGIALLVFGVLRLFSAIRVLEMLGRAPLFAATIFTVVGASILLGLLFGMPLIVKLIPGESSAEQKAAELSAKISGFQIIIGLAGIVASLVWLLFYFGIINPM